MEEQLVLERKLDGLKIQHKELDALIRKMDEDKSDDLQMARLKKQKLRLKDEITKIEREIYDDLIA